MDISWIDGPGWLAGYLLVFSATCFWAVRKSPPKPPAHY